MTVGRYVGVVCLCALSVILSAEEYREDYQIGRGLKCSEYLTLGAYFSVEYGNSDAANYATVEDLAVLGYGVVGEGFSYLLELESTDVYRYDFSSGDSAKKMKPAIERLYGDYKFSDAVAVRVGKLISPIGYWNLQPINVLRETTSNPIFSTALFPKFLSGIDVSGYLPFDPAWTYHVYAQATRDIDTEYINIDVDSHYGISLQRSLGGGFQAGGSAGYYTIHGSDAEVSYFQANTRWDRDEISLFSEAVIASRESVNGSQDTSSAAYLQGEYHFNARQAGIIRVEYYNDFNTSEYDWTAVIGFSYRPLYPVSLKLEYQIREASRDNKFLSSFSVLF